MVSNLQASSQAMTSVKLTMQVQKFPNSLQKKKHK